MAPHNLGLPPIHDPKGYWDPLFSVVNEADVPLCTHLGTGLSFDPSQIDTAKIAKLIEERTGGDPTKLGDLAKSSDLAKVFESMTGGRPPSFVQRMVRKVAGKLIRVILAKAMGGNFAKMAGGMGGGMGGMGGGSPRVGGVMMQLADWMTEMSRERVAHPVDPENDPLLSDEARKLARLTMEARALRDQSAPLPSEVFRKHMYGCFINDPVGLKLIHEIGVDNVMIETDFPHNSTWFPHSMQKAQEWLKGLPVEVKWKVLRGNAERVFKFVPVQVSA
jgi:hypothetical protein